VVCTSATMGHNPTRVKLKVSHLRSSISTQNRTTQMWNILERIGSLVETAKEGYEESSTSLTKCLRAWKIMLHPISQTTLFCVSVKKNSKIMEQRPPPQPQQPGNILYFCKHAFRFVWCLETLAFVDNYLGGEFRVLSSIWIWTRLSSRSGATYPSAHIFANPELIDILKRNHTSTCL